MILLIPIIQFLRLPSMPPEGLWRGDSESGEEVDWGSVGELLANTCDDPNVAADLRRSIRDLPNDLPVVIRAEVDRRKKLSGELRMTTLRHAALLAFLSPQRHLDALILLWINLRQVYVLSRCHGFKPSPRGIVKLYAGVIGSVLVVEAFDEIAEQMVADAATRLTGGIPIAGEASKLLYDPLRAAASVGFVGLIAEHLLKSGLTKPSIPQRIELRRSAWRNSIDAATTIRERTLQTKEPA